jgi:hypothetical protein
MQGVDERADRRQDFARDEAASSSIETALLLSLMATFVFVLRSSLGGADASEVRRRRQHPFASAELAADLQGVP